MPSLVMVDDPLYQGSAPAPQLPRTWAMRKLHFEGGVSVGEVARRYGVPYQRAYNAIKSADPQSAALSNSPATLQPAGRSKPAALTESAAAASAARPDSPAAQDEPRRTRPGPKLKTHTRAELKSWSITELKLAVRNKGLVAGSPYAVALEAELDSREPGWWDKL